MFTTIDLPLTAPLPTGENVLAIHGLNDSASSPNFLLVPELDVARPSASARRTSYFSTPTPGTANSLGLPAIAPAPVFSQASGVRVGDIRRFDHVAGSARPNSLHARRQRADLGGGALHDADCHQRDHAG